MIGYIYKTTNLINNKIYIGKRQKSQFDKYYYGSGKYLSNAINKYGKENFSVDILEWCESKEKLNDREKYWIKYYDSRNSDIGYNISEGGDGNGENGKLNSLFCYVYNDSGYIRILKSDKDVYLHEGYISGKGPKTNGLCGTKKSDETKLKMSISGKGKHDHHGSKNPTFGVHYKWITNGNENRRINIDQDIPDGWTSGKVQSKPIITDKFKSYLDLRRTDQHWKGDNNPSKSIIGTHWYNNGTEQHRFTEYNVPDGYVKGRLRK